MDSTMIIVSVIAGMVLFAALIIFSTIVGGWLVFRGIKANNSTEPFLGRDSSPGAYSINTDGPDFPGAEPNEHEDHVLKKTENFLKALGGKE